MVLPVPRCVSGGASEAVPRVQRPRSQTATREGPRGVWRREFFWISGGMSCIPNSRKARASSTSSTSTSGTSSRSFQESSENVKIPLHWDAGGFYLYFTLSSDGSASTSSRRIYAVADTGSPFLLVAKCLRSFEQQSTRGFKGILFRKPLST